MSQITCVVVTPESTALDEKVDFVALPLFDGEMGVGSNHSPMIGRLGFGELRLRNGSTTRSYYVEGGFVQIANNVVSVLTNSAIPAEEVKAGTGQTQLDEAMKLPTSTDEEYEIRERKVAQARAQMRIGS